jgi:hypothetical protein
VTISQRFFFFLFRGPPGKRNVFFKNGNRYFPSNSHINNRSMEILPHSYQALSWQQFLWEAYSLRPHIAPRRVLLAIYDKTDPGEDMLCAWQTAWQTGTTMYLSSSGSRLPNPIRSTDPPRSTLVCGKAFRGAVVTHPLMEMKRQLSRL